MNQLTAGQSINQSKDSEPIRKLRQLVVPFSGFSVKALLLTNKREM
jgi:hypothetical protein